MALIAAGKTVTNANGNLSLPYFRMSLSSGPSTNISGFTKVAVNNGTSDPSGMTSTANSRATIPSGYAGWWQFGWHASGYNYSNNSRHFWAMLHIYNSSAVLQCQLGSYDVVLAPSGGDLIRHHADGDTWLYDCAVGDYAELHIYMDGSSPSMFIGDTSGTPGCYFWGIMIGG